MAKIITKNDWRKFFRSQNEIADQFNVRTLCIWKVLNSKTWN